MPSHDFFTTVDIGLFSYVHEDDRWREPEIIIDPLSGFVVAIVPASSQPPRPRRPNRRKRRVPGLWRDALSRWLGLAGQGAML